MYFTGKERSKFVQSRTNISSIKKMFFLLSFPFTHSSGIFTPYLVKKKIQIPWKLTNPWRRQSRRWICLAITTVKVQKDQAITQMWATYGPWTRYDPLGFRIQTAPVQGMHYNKATVIHIYATRWPQTSNMPIYLWKFVYSCKFYSYYFIKHSTSN